MEPSELEELLRSTDFEVRNVEPAGAGIMGALRVEAYYPDADRTLEWKWKIAPASADGWNNTPRREIAVYEIQRWFLAPENYVVPPTVGLCIPLAVYADIQDEAGPNLPGTNCVFGALSAWLQNVEPADPLLEEERFYREPHYALHLAHYNLVTYLSNNRDTRASNRVAAKAPAPRRVYAVDNGITFGEWFYNWFKIGQWEDIQVPALPRAAIERLRDVDGDDLSALLVLAEYRLDSEGVLRETEPSEPFDTDRGARLRDGVLQLGLVPEEIEDLEERIEELLEEIDDGKIPLF